MDDSSESKKCVRSPIISCLSTILFSIIAAEVQDVLWKTVFWVLQAAQQRQQSETFHQRWGGEATISQGVRAFDLRRSRYIGLPKTHLQHVAIATAINQTRLVDWLDGTSLTPTRVLVFERLSNAE